ncbi:MAG: CvpA family protein [Clostridia bacterium]|nr:CvpA family protein [Clostridia bacterium]
MLADVIFIICLAVAFFVGYKTGFLRALVGFLGMIVSAIGGYLLYPYVTPVLMKTPLYNWVNNGVLVWIKGYLSRNETAAEMEQLFSKYKVFDVDALTTAMASGITTVILNIISIILIILGIKLGILILKKFTNIINHVPVVGTLNRLCGMVLSGASFITVCFILVAVLLLPPSNTTELSRNICEEIDRSTVVREVMDYNFFINYKSLSQGR